MRSMKWCPTPRATAGWLVAVLVVVCGLGLMSAWARHAPAQAMAATADDPAPQADPNAGNPMKGEPTTPPDATATDGDQEKSKEPAK